MEKFIAKKITEYAEARVIVGRRVLYNVNKIKNTFHILCHTGCTGLGENNVNPKVMQYVMGYSDAHIMNIYNQIVERSHVEGDF